MIDAYFQDSSDIRGSLMACSTQLCTLLPITLASHISRPHISINKVTKTSSHNACSRSRPKKSYHRSTWHRQSQSPARGGGYQPPRNGQPGTRLFHQGGRHLPPHQPIEWGAFGPVRVPCLHRPVLFHMHRQRHVYSISGISATQGILALVS